MDVGVKKLIESLLRLLPLPVLLVAVSYRVDPAGLYHNVVAPLADEWARTGETRVPGNVDERLFQAEVLRRAPKDITALVLGSSRSMQVTGSCLPGEILLNVSVSGASLKDHLALAEAAREAGLRPKVVLLNLDPWLLNRNSGQDRWKSLVALVARSVQRLGVGPTESPDLADPRLQKLGQLVSPAYFQESLKAIWSRRKGATREEAFIRVIHRDGSTGYPEAYASRSVDDAAALADRYVAKPPVYALEEFGELDPTSALQLKAFIQTLLEDGARIRFVLAPYHPRVYSFLTRHVRYRQVQAAERWYRALAQGDSIAVTGSFDPGACGMTEADFLDGMHLREAALARLLRSAR